MPYRIEKNKGGGYSVKSPHGAKAKNTTKEKAEAQVKLLQGIEDGWKPTGKKAKKAGSPAHNHYPHHSPARPL